MSTELVNTDRTSMDRLVAEARQAFEEKRAKECLALIKTIFSADPENAEARMLESAIKQQISRDLNDARALLEDSRIKEDGQKYRRAAEIVVLKTLNLDPNNEEAQALLAVARGGVVSSESYEAARSSESEPATTGLADLEFTVGTARTVAQASKQKKPETSREMSLKIPLIAAGVIILLGLAFILGNSFIRNWRTAASTESSQPRQSTTTVSSAQASPAPSRFGETPSRIQPQPPVPVVQTVATTTNVVPKSVAPPLPPVPAAPDAAPPSNSEVKPGAKQGTLAVSSLIPAEIYLDNKHLGSTPATLQLPVGRQTLDYRHGDLRTVVTHNIKSNETTTALITFETVVQINAKPWAQVFLEGTTRRPLGQTPLSDVRVPIGGVLVFENPNFPSKSYRIAEKETAVQVVFP